MRPYQLQASEPPAPEELLLEELLDEDELELLLDEELDELELELDELELLLELPPDPPSKNASIIVVGRRVFGFQAPIE